MLLILTHSICIVLAILLYNNFYLVIAHTMQISCGLITPNAVKKKKNQTNKNTSGYGFWYARKREEIIFCDATSTGK